METVFKCKYFYIKRKDIENKKTPIFKIYTNLDDFELGEIKWHGAWRTFTFYPANDTLWDTHCLLSLSCFLDNLNTSWKGNITNDK